MSKGTGLILAIALFTIVAQSWALRELRDQIEIANLNTVIVQEKAGQAIMEIIGLANQALVEQEYQLRKEFADKCYKKL